MKINILLFVLIFVSSAIAKDIKIKVDPLRPVFKENYQISMTVKVQGDEEPQISFTPINMEVLSKTLRL